MMEFYINFRLDEEFNESIESPIHEDFSYSSFSEGEKMRIDLASCLLGERLLKSKTLLIVTLSFLTRHLIRLWMGLEQTSL